jgi:hypothetical protein
VTGVAVDGDGAVLLAGSSSAGVDFGGGPVASGDAYVAKLSQDGSYVFGQALGGAQIRSITATGSKDVLVAGTGSGSIGVGSAQIPAATSGFDLLAIELDPSGNLVSDRRAGNGAGVIANQIAVNASGEVAVVAASRAGGVDMGTGALSCTASCLLVARLRM